jgi:tRNA modification GTPase
MRAPQRFETSHDHALPASPSSALLLAGGEDTIVALATSDGRGALALLRLSGPNARGIASALGIDALAPRVATRVQLKHPIDDVPLDDALATWFPGPRSYTGEDVLELSTHGGRVVPASVLGACVAAGARLALPGEFTRRAVLNGRMDLVQAEAVADLIDARTVGMQQQALSQLDGGLSRRFVALRDDVIALEALIAYDIDFPGEDDGPIAPERITSSATSLLASLDGLLATAPRAALLRDGALVVIAGPPNAGKSSLFNALLGESRALVTPIAGTTRDAIEAVLDRRPMPLRLVDTAGMRDTTDTIELLGIEVSRRYLGGARVVLACGATSEEVAATVAAIAPLTGARVVAVRTKSDLSPADASERLPTIAVSAETGDGLSALLAHLDHILRAETDGTLPAPDVMLTRERHRHGVATAREEIAEFLTHWSSGALPAPVAAVHLQSARDALGGVIGVIDTDDVLERVFRDFCIGK